ncbi:Glucosyl-3-phosphoglycerate synthase [Corynebacterium kalinowskii]|uniref:Glucosyl-3-phosphoglycerate synthase n=1 Tax=Corynebacterium kalinowskii TaxID=2675216 RepID=A0A6B8VTX5_9CORY|nr:glucosyl-3-phosphoglycerate synthase [Corynebacterium kalinowskii]QGU02395.1 Glucosyl-3-phosphoglycerate synthase [Corynebacterium kalinowskii]
MSELLRRASVVIPALNEGATVAEVVRCAVADGPGEVIVIDSDSTDATAREAERAGAVVLNWREVLPDVETRPGKGEALWRGVAAARGEIVVFLDADLLQPRSHLVRDLVAPFSATEVQLVKGHYQRAFEGHATGGGRVTELTAKPLLRHFFPELSGVQQPLGGEYAIRRPAARELPFTEGYGVEVGLLLDVAEKYGPEAIAQVDLGSRFHRNRPLAELAPMADIVSRTVLSRVPELLRTVARPHERPPLATLST